MTDHLRAIAALAAARAYQATHAPTRPHGVEADEEPTTRHTAHATDEAAGSPHR